jgi:hypothetical protein
MPLTCFLRARRPHEVVCILDCGIPIPTDQSYREWLTHQHRDTLSSIVGHPTLTSYLSIADGVAVGRTKFEMMEVSSALMSLLPSC